MKKIITLLALSFCLNGKAQGEYVIEINRTDGSYINTGSHIAGISLIACNLRAYNENEAIYIFLAQDSLNAWKNRLYSIDVSNDSIINNPVCSKFLGELEYSNSLNKLYGVLLDSTINVKYLVTIDPVLGVPTTTIGSPIPYNSTNSGKSTFNQVSNQYIFLNINSNNLYTIDVATGNVISNPSIVFAAGFEITSLCYNDSTNSLFGVFSNGTTSYLASINQSTGAYTQVSTSINLPNNGSSAIDLINQQYLYLYPNTIVTFDILTGNVIYNNNMTSNSTWSLKYDNIRHKLYSLRWGPPPCGDCAGIEQYANNKEQVNIYPNPNNGSFVIEPIPSLTLPQGKGTLMQVYDVNGKLVLTQTINGKTTIDASSLNEGVYNISLQSNEGVVNKRLVIVSN